MVSLFSVNTNKIAALNKSLLVLINGYGLIKQLNGYISYIQRTAYTTRKPRALIIQEL